MKMVDVLEQREYLTDLKKKISQKVQGDFFFLKATSRQAINGIALSMTIDYFIGCLFS